MSELQMMVKAKQQQWNAEASGYFCRLARKGAQFTNVVYPTGLRVVRAEFGNEKAEVSLPVAKQLRADGFRVIG